MVYCDQHVWGYFLSFRSNDIQKYYFQCPYIIECSFMSSIINNWTLAWWLECLPIAWEIWVQSQVESYQRLKKWYLMPPCWTLSIMCGSRVKWSYPGKGVVPFPTPQCISYWKGNLWVTLNYCRLLYFIINKRKNCLIVLFLRFPFTNILL